MATPPEQPWSNHERNYLLAEIIKAANPHSDVLLNVIRNHRIEPRWEEIPLPQGRSLNSSRFAYDSMQRSLLAHSMPMGPQTPMTVPGPTLKRPFPPPDAPYSASGREIRPKPLIGGPGYAQQSPSEPPPKRKRGRPTKAEQQAKAEAAAAAMGYESGPARPAPSIPSLMSLSTQSSGPSPVTEEAKPMLPPTTRMPIAAMLTPTTRETKSASNSSSSSGKKRRGRSAKSEPEGTPTARSRSDYDPSSHELRAAPEDSPARTAVLRHREEMAPATRSEPPRPSPESGQQQQQQPRSPYLHPPQSQPPPQQ